MKALMREIESYFEGVYTSTRRCIVNGYEWGNSKEFVHSSIQQCLGVTMFALQLGVDYTDIEKLYEEFKEKLEKLLTK